MVIKKKKPQGLAARCMFGLDGSSGISSSSSSSSGSSDRGQSAVCIRTCKPFTVNVWSSGDFGLRDCPLSLMASVAQAP